MSQIPEPIKWNEVKALLEAQGQKISTIAESVADIHPRFVKLESAIDSLTEDMGMLKPAVQRLAKTVESLTEDMKVVKPAVQRLAKTVESLTEDMKVVKPAVQKNTSDIDAIKTTLDHHTQALARIEKRLEAAEAKLPA